MDDFTEESEKLSTMEDAAGEKLNHAFDFVEDVFSDGQEMLVFVTELTITPEISSFLAENECEKFDIYNEKLMVGSNRTRLLKELESELDPLEDIWDLIRRSIVDDPPITVRDGGIIKEGFHEEADRLRNAKTEGKTWLAELEAREKEKTGIKTLKVKYNKVFGYYFEVTNSFKDMVPDYFVRKQTLTNAERFTTDELKQLEDVIMGAEEKLTALEYDLFCQARDSIAAQVVRIQKTAKAIEYVKDGNKGEIALTENDLVFITNGSCTEGTIYGCLLYTSPSPRD